MVTDNILQLITVSGNFNVGEKLISSSQTTSNNANQFLEDSNGVVTIATITTKTLMM